MVDLFCWVYPIFNYVANLGSGKSRIGCRECLGLRHISMQKKQRLRPHFPWNQWRAIFSMMSEASEWLATTVNDVSWNIPVLCASSACDPFSWRHRRTDHGWMDRSYWVCARAASPGWLVGGLEHFLFIHIFGIINNHPNWLIFS